MAKLNNIYKKLLVFHGQQGWWPVVKNNSISYHTGAPHNSKESFEIIIGAILAQGISWSNVATAMVRLKQAKVLSPRTLFTLPGDELAVYIRSTGYFNQKVLKIKEFLYWLKTYSFSLSTVASQGIVPLRLELLSIKGIGPETADSILLYALNKKIFVIDAYTKRIFNRIGIIQETATYDQVQEFFHNNFKGDVTDYNEFHALIVAQGKICKKTKPLCGECPLRKQCAYSRLSLQEDS